MAELIAKAEGLESRLDEKRPIPLLRKQSSQLTNSNQVTKDIPRRDAKEACSV